MCEVARGASAGRPLPSPAEPTEPTFRVKGEKKGRKKEGDPKAPPLPRWLWGQSTFHISNLPRQLVSLTQHLVLLVVRLLWRHDARSQRMVGSSQPDVRLSERDRRQHTLELAMGELYALPETFVDDFLNIMGVDIDHTIR